MTGNDLPRLLDAAVPDPPHGLDGDALVRRARRRRTVRAAAVPAVTALAVLAGVAVADGLSTAPPVRPPAAGRPVTPYETPVPVATPPDPRRWPDDVAVTVRCAATYPDDLPRHTFAFAGTVTAVRVDERAAPDARGTDRRVELDFDVDRIYEGAPRMTATLTTWQSYLPVRRYSLVGIRVLAATGDTLELQLCGFTRRYTDAASDEWARAFGPRTEYCDLDLEAHRPDPKSPERYVPEYVGMSVEEATRLAESRGLHVRLLGGGMLRDLRDDRVNLCAPDGIVTAAAIY